MGESEISGARERLGPGPRFRWALRPVSSGETCHSAPHISGEWVHIGSAPVETGAQATHTGLRVGSRERGSEMLFLLAGVDILLAAGLIAALIWLETMATIIDPHDRIPTIGL